MSRASKQAKKERQAEKRKDEQMIARGIDPVKMQKLKDRIAAKRAGKKENRT